MNATIATIAAIRQHIISSCIEAAGGQLFPCVKQSVYAVVITADGRAYYGANWMTSADVTICPRILANTTSYELCSTVCGQGTEFHAERQAMWSALYDGADLTGAEVFITGHTYCCDTCRAAMYEEGITYAASIDSGIYYERGETTMEEPKVSVKLSACEYKSMWSGDLDEYNTVIISIGTKQYQFNEYPEAIEVNKLIGMLKPLGIDVTIEALEHLQAYDAVNELL
jgi:cytidine deaminase